MKTYFCVNCGKEVRRPTPPLSCPACGQQRIGLFKEKPAGVAPQAPAPGRAAPAAGPLPPPGPVFPQPAPPAYAPVMSTPAPVVAPVPAASVPPAAAMPAAPVPPFQHAAPVAPAPAYGTAAPVFPMAPVAPPAPVAAPLPPAAPVAPAPRPVPSQPAAPVARMPAAPPYVAPAPPAALPPRPAAAPPHPAAAIPLQPASTAPLRPPVPTVPAFHVPEEGDADVVMLEAVAGGESPGYGDAQEDYESAMGVGLDEPREAPPEMADVPAAPAHVVQPPRLRRPAARRPDAEPPPPPATLYPEPAEPAAAPEPEPPPRPAPRPATAAPRPKPAAPAPPPPPKAAPEEPPPAAKAKPAGERRAPGTILWQYPKQIPGQAYSTAPIRCCPVVFGKNQFAVCIGSVLVGLDWKGSGLEKLWECNTEGHIPGSPVLGADGLIRMHSGDGWLHCIDQNGGRVWEPVPVGEPLGWASPLVDGNGNTYISGYAGGIYKVSPRGDFKNTPYFRSRQKFDSTGLLYRGMLYIGCEDAFVYAIQLSDATGKNVWDHLGNRGKTEWFINSAIALAPDSTIVVAGRDEHLYGFNQDGKQLWKVHIPGQMLASPVISAAGDVVVGISMVRATQADQGKLVCVDGESHRVRWEYEAKGAIESTPVIGDDDIVYVGDNTGHVHAVRLDGTPVWRQSVKNPVRSAGIIVGANRLVFGLDNGTLVGLLCSSGGVAPRGWPKFLAK